MVRAWVLMFGLLLAGCGGGGMRTGTGLGASNSIECAPFARQVSGIQLYGDAAAWWDQADGRYDRGTDPVEGGVLVFRRSGRLPSGHVSVVARLVSSREIHVTQANWVHHRITRDEPVVDVSPGNDWSRVRVWWAPSNTLGSTEYQTFGFIVPDRSRSRSELVAGLQQP
jgi:hypothetical protein